MATLDIGSPGRGQREDAFNVAPGSAEGDRAGRRCPGRFFASANGASSSNLVTAIRQETLASFHGAGSRSTIRPERRARFHDALSTIASAAAEDVGAHRERWSHIWAMHAAPQMAEVAALVGDPARANILCALLDGRALTAGELAFAAGVSPQTTSGHLAKLHDARLIDLCKQGRHRYYRLAGSHVGQMLESIMTVALTGPPRFQPRSKTDEPAPARAYLLRSPCWRTWRRHRRLPDRRAST